MSSKPKGKAMSDAERSAMIKKMEDDLDRFINEKIEERKQRKQARGDEDNDDDLDFLGEDLHNHPAFIKEIDWSQPLSPELQGLIELKYDVSDAKLKAENYKDDGNVNFKNSKYRWAVANYTEAIKAKCADKELNAVLYSNRAAAQYRVGNFRSALNDTVLARKFKPDHMKAIAKGIECGIQLKRFDFVMKWCEDGLMLEPDNEKFIEMRQKAEQLKKVAERDKRKEEAAARKEEQQKRALLEAIKQRGIKLCTEPAGDADDEADLLGDADYRSLFSRAATEASGEARTSEAVLDDRGTLHWPLLFLYPEYGQTDFICSASEESSLSDHLNVMFGPHSEPPPWDCSRAYNPLSIEIYFEDRDKEELHPVHADSSLLSVLSGTRYRVYNGLPSFIVLARGTQFRDEYLKKYRVSQ